jgi:hypothetical protein
VGNQIRLRFLTRNLVMAPFDDKSIHLFMYK